MGQSASLEESMSKEMAKLIESVQRDGHCPTSEMMLSLNLIYRTMIHNNPEIDGLCEKLGVPQTDSPPSVRLLDHYYRVFALFCDMTEEKDSALAMVDTLQKQTTSIVLLTDEGNEMVANPKTTEIICHQLADHCRDLERRLTFYQPTPHHLSLEQAQDDHEGQSEALHRFLESHDNFLKLYFWEESDQPNTLYNPLTCSQIVIT